ncbi:sugar phosphate isomerase/epimerase [Actinospica durhamensis]|uniref:Sugar phosphate isomerase/epimerase n=1 Tax=Actinospica durhamensis TaxID=1508375 RepID=A0A941IQ02_9ACTN|nr:sugar phosphate isomerase/epimerase [Actinospica durhamensis]MBR7835694.1 sugar phosphate isomerase/epimerase [Actinospica durhamensis]
MSRLSVHCSLLTVPGSGPLSARLRLIAEAGFDGVQTVPPDASSRVGFAHALAESGLEVSGCCHLTEDQPAEPMFERAAAAGMTSLNAQVDGYWRDEDWQDARVTELLDLSTRYGLPFFLETHRHRLTQDIRRTIALTERHPALILCGDFSHYTVMSELRAPWPDEWRAALHTLARRCGEIHARVNDGQRVQDPLPLVGAAQRGEFFELWRTARAAWPGPRFLMTTELLPASIGYDTTDLRGRPVGDIWEDSRRLLGAIVEGNI